MLRRDTSARRTARLSRLECLAVGDTAADFVNNLTQCSTHRNLNKSRVVYLAAECEYLCSL